MKGDCIFCSIINKEIESHIVYEDDLVIAFMDINPINTGHVLIVPKEHAQFISDVPELTAARMFNTAQKINTAIRKSEIKSEGINFWLADGEAALQDVFHAHLHCIPRYKDDGFKIKLPESYKMHKTSEELHIQAEEIKEHLSLQ